LQDLLAQSEDKTGKKLKTWIEVQEAWIEAQKEKSRLDNLPELRKRLKELDRRVQSHRQALELVRWFEQNYPQIGNLAQMGRQAFEEIVNNWEDLDFEASIARIKDSLEKLERQISELEKGRPSLPQAIGQQVDAGRLSLLASRFEHLDLEKAQEVQAKLGPFAGGIEVREPGEISDLDLGDEEFLLVKKGLDLDQLTSLQTGQGHISGQGDFYWYTPHSYVWLGAQARARELKRLDREKNGLLKELEGLENEKLQNKERLKRARRLTGMWSALEDKACIKEYDQVQAEVSWLEKEAPAIQDRYRYLDALQRKKEHFELHEAPNKFNKIQKELQKQEKELKSLEKDLSKLEKEFTKVQQDMEALQQDYAKSDNRLAGVNSRIQSLLDEEPREVLQGNVDFSQAKEVKNKIEALDRDLADLERTRDNLNRENVRKADLLKQIQNELERLDKENQQAEEAKEKFLEKWNYFYPQQEPQFRKGNYSSEDASKLSIEWEMAEKELKKTISSTVSDYALHLPLDVAPEIQVDMILENIIPSFLELDKVEDQFQRLRQELGEIEARIKTYVQDIQKKVDQEIIKLKRRLVKVNDILADIRFGRISQVKIELNYLKHYENLKKLQGDVLTLMDFGSQTTLNEFVQTLVRNIFKDGRGDINEEQIADYRTYIDLSWSITDLDGESRQKGFSGGETLGINLAICLGLLFHWGGEAGQAQARGLLIMALDEAERLDEQAVHTVRELLDRAGSQLLVALPRTVQIPDTICHMLTPLQQGVTHVSVYHKG
jgi:chromosome partition protein MukB